MDFKGSAGRLSEEPDKIDMSLGKAVWCKT